MLTPAVQPIYISQMNRRMKCAGYLKVFWPKKNTGDGE